MMACRSAGFLAWLNSKVDGTPYRLPSEAEWEFAARAGTQTRYSFGNSGSALGAHAWYDGNANGQPHPVGRKRENDFGLHDMHGNVWEWVQDCWNESRMPAPPRTDLAWMNVNEENCSRAVLRGGSWNGQAQESPLRAPLAGSIATTVSAHTTVSVLPGR